MSVGILEIVLLLVVSVGALLASALGRNWFYLGIAPLFAVAVIVTPADPLSCLMAGVPLILVFALTINRLNARNASENR